MPTHPSILTKESLGKAKVPVTTWTVSGRVTYSFSGRPAAGVRVTAMDADLIFHDKLGETRTDAEGRFKITYSAEQFRDLFERHPDIYLLVHDAKGHLLTTTRDSVIRNAGPLQEIFVQLPGSGLEPVRPTTQVGGAAVDRVAFERLMPDEMLGIARAVFQGEHLPENLKILQALSPRLMPEELRKRLCFTPLRRFLMDAVKVKRWPREVALELEEVFTGYHPYGGYATFDSPNFSFTYQTSGADQPPAADTGGNITMPGTGAVVGSTIAGNGVPDYIETMSFWLENALATYTNPPFSLRNPAAGGKIPVNVSGVGGGSAAGGAMTVSRDLNNDLLAAVPTHELMHLIQELYATAGGGDWQSGMVEGGAVLGEDVVFDTHNRYIVEASLEPAALSPWSSGGTLRSPEIPLKDPDQCYQLALFLKYISEQMSGRVGGADEPTIGVETYRALLETFDTEGYTDAAFAGIAAYLPWYQSFTRFGYLDAAHLDETSSETLLGNFWLACYLKDLGTGVPDRRFEFMEDEEDATWDSLFLGSDLVSTLGALRTTVDTTLTAGGSITLSAGAGGSVSPFAARAYKVTIDPAVNTFRLSFNAGGGFTAPVVQVALVETGNVVRDILRTDRTTWERTIANDRAGTSLNHILVIVAGSETGGTFGLNLTEAPPAPDVMISRWHHAAGQHYEIDSFGYSWTWVSPDIWVDNDLNGVADSEVYFDQNNKLFVRLHNQGHANATDISVELWYQNAAGGLSEGAWLPVQDVGGVTQQLTHLNLAAGTTDQWSVDWAPVPAGTSNHFCIRAVVTAPGDPNADNKRCLSNFGNVKAAAPYFDLPMLRRAPRNLFGEMRVDVIPRAHGRWTVSAVDLARANGMKLGPGERTVDLFRLRYHEELKRQTGEVAMTPEFAAKTPSVVGIHHGTPLQRRPDPFGHYPTDPRALPPGLANADLITIAHVVDGKPVGGFTWAIRKVR